jgi:hypothetical protein
VQEGDRLSGAVFPFLADAQINKLSYGLDANYVEPAEITMRVIQGIYAGIVSS